MLRNTVIKFASDAADGSFVADVSSAKAAGSHAADVIAELGNDDRLAHPSGLNCRGNSCDSATVNAYIRFNYLRGPKLKKVRAN
jgi:hypothetical protein